MAHIVRSSSQWYFISQDVERFGFINERMIPTSVLLSDVRGFPISGCGWSMAMMLLMIGAIVCPLRNIPPVSASAAGATTFFSVCKRVRMGPFNFGLGVSVGGG